jgi:hypothetical protein
MRLVGEAHAFEQRVRGAHRFGAIAAENPDRRGDEVVEHAQVRKQVVLLEHEADALAQRDFVALGCEPVDARAVDVYQAALRPQQPGDAAQDRRFAGAGRPDDRHGLAAVHVEIDTAQHGRRAVGQMHVAQADERLVRAARSFSGMHDVVREGG